MLTCRPAPAYNGGMTASVLSVKPSDLSYHRVTGEITIGYRSLGFVAPPLTYGESGRRALAAAQADHRDWLAQDRREHARVMRERAQGLY